MVHVCGLAGFVGRPGANSELGRVAAGMAECLRHRGPDDAGAWADEVAGVAFGFRRLSILDLSPAGHQPMTSSDGRYVLVFNGEIYNYASIKKDLENVGARFRGRSDTETLLEGIKAWGLRKTLERVEGMFALAIWDHEERAVFLARDRFGEKPLYYGMTQKSFLFASQPDSFLAYPTFEGRVDRASTAAFFRFGYVPSPHSIYQGVYKLPPATWIRYAPNDPRPSEPERYWSSDATAHHAASEWPKEPLARSIDLLDQVLGDSVAARMASDVPLGALLSGGIDSTAVVAAMQRNSSAAIRTFTIGFSQPQYDEAGWAAAVARRLGTDHTEMYVSAKQALDVIPLLPHIYDEPFADSSQIPTILVSQLARQHVTVALTGDGGDELFGGYSRYAGYALMQKRLAYVPRDVKIALGRGLARLSPRQLNFVAQALNRTFTLPVSRVDEKLARLATVLAAGALSSSDSYRSWVSICQDPQSIVVGAEEHASPFSARAKGRVIDNWAAAMLWDTKTYLPDDILVKVDRAAMAVGLETRTPFLDQRVFEYAWRLPLEQKVHGGTGKYVLRELVARQVGRELVDRPKMGFRLPLASWLRQELRPWADDLLSLPRIKAQGILDPGRVQATWGRHRSGAADHQDEVWSMLMFQAWLNRAER